MRVIGLVWMILVSAAAFPVWAQSPAEPGAFDYYLLNLSWEPEFCHSPRNAGSEECQTGGRGFIVHGLWPQYTDGYPRQCSTAMGPENPAAMLDIMPSVGLVRHEWKTHGTCSGLRPDDYFGKLRQAFSSIVIPDQLKQPARGFSITPGDLKQTFVAANPRLHEAGIAVSCGHNYLTAVEFCLSKDLLQPTTCGTVRDCHANVIRVTPVK